MKTLRKIFFTLFAVAGMSLAVSAQKNDPPKPPKKDPPPKIKPGDKPPPEPPKGDKPKKPEMSFFIVVREREKPTAEEV